MATHLQLGMDGEEVALRFLLQKSFRLLQRNWRSKHLEIDLVMLDGPILVFVEVKTRTRGDYGLPYESVNIAKQRKLLRAANRYLQLFGHEGEIRFDIVSIFAQKDKQFNIRHIPDAFWPYR